MRWLGLVVALVALAGCGGGEAQESAPDGDRFAARQLDPAAFEQAVRDPETVLVNVHVPYEGKIAGTDRFVDYRDASRAELPRGRRIALYCETGNMSQTAARELRRRGYDDLVELAGGMVAWESADLALLDRR